VTTNTAQIQQTLEVRVCSEHIKQALRKFDVFTQADTSPMNTGDITVHLSY